MREFVQYSKVKLYSTETMSNVITQVNWRPHPVLTYL